MHIKASPIEGIKKEFAGFELDASKVELHSSNKYKIRLPYSGPLPDALQENDGAFLTVGISVGLTVGVGLLVKIGKKERRFSVDATPQEKNDLLFSFFFVDKGSNSFHTRWDAGLTRYWLGAYQDAYTHWRRFVYEGYGIDGVIDQLPPEALNRVIRYIYEYKRTA